ncbi:fibronectin type III domain-containing protein 4 isoform X2 [Cylas formicarius]|uniref:fibronectin type III domain-containing protein 4 isoform X2 n=1 Tax=Cylas formicarius TaxID=197179 RepID=UPI0029586381|nr:fibronectin type III domain-containing protein 4 isoform X2 [Cylas formicarius]
MFLLAAAILLLTISLAGSMPGGPGVPENITVTFLNPTSVRVSWATSVDNADKYDVTYKPTDERVVAVVAGNSDAVTLRGLKADTQYQLTVAAVWQGKKYRSRPIVFRTLEFLCVPEPPRSFPQQDSMAAPFSTETPTFKETTPADIPVEYPQTSSTVRGVEIGIVLLVLVVWVAAIALFFNRWGKIRMLLPYQPDYKQEQLKVPGTAACAAAVASGNTCVHPGPNICQQIHAQPPRTPRPRMNSAIFVSNSGPGIDPKEFFRRHGSVSKLCRKARSVDNISLEDKHFGLPTLSISGPSPPEDDETEIVESPETQRFLCE